MAVLYILSEGERDELFYDILAERVTGNVYDPSEDFRLRHGAIGELPWLVAGCS